MIVYGEVVSVEKKTALEWCEGYELTSGGCALWFANDWRTIKRVFKVKGGIAFACDNVQLSYEEDSMINVGFRARGIVCDKCQSKNVGCWDSQPVEDEDGHQVGERGFFVCGDCNHRFTEE
jgi:hypothetical protein